MIKKTLLSVALFIIIVSLTSCGGGTGSSSTPRGVNTGIPSVVQLLPVSYIAQTNSNVTFKARILDGNGNPVKNVPVTFTNLSSIGTFKSAFADSGVTTFAAGPTVVMTDSLGYAIINVFSSSSGWVTILSQVDEGVVHVRDRKTIFFTTSDTLVLVPTLTLDVDGDGDGIYNETSPVGNDDFTLFETATDNQVMVRATFKDGIGQLLKYYTVTFGADVPYRVGADPTAQCSDGSTTCEVTFPFGNTATTDESGEAFVFVEVTPVILRTIPSILNITAQADFGVYRAYNIVTLFLSSVTVTTVTVSANPTTVDSEGTSTITAFVLTSAGTPVPDGTSVNFTTTAGGIEPFAQTTDGIAEVTFTAPELADGVSDLAVTITATVAGVLGTTTVTVTADPLALAVNPPTSSISGVTGGTRTFTISGGTLNYSAFSSNLSAACNSTDTDCSDAADTDTWSVTTDPGTFTVTIPAGTPAQSVTLTVQDSVGGMDTATLTITGPSALQVSPETITMGCGTVSPNGPVFTVSGGVVGVGYAILSLNTAIIEVSTATVLTDGGTFRADAKGSIPTACTNMGALTTIDVDVTVTDNGSPTSTETVTITVTNP